MQRREKIFTVLCVFGFMMFIFSIYVGITIFKDLKTENALENEIIELSELINSDGIWDKEIDYKLNNYVSKDNNYLQIEKASKKYFKDLISDCRSLYKIYNDDFLSKIMSIENIKADGKEFINTKTFLNKSITDITNLDSDINSLLTEERIMSYLDENTDEYYLDYYKDLMLEDDDIDVIREEVKEEMDNYLDLIKKIDNIFTFLIDNNKDWDILDDKIYFKTQDSLDKYNYFLQEISNFDKNEKQII